MSLPGKILYHSWHRPFGAFRDLIAAGGAFEIQRTKRGSDEMEAAAAQLPLLSITIGTPLELHLLTGKRFWFQTTFCLWTFARQAGRPLAPTIYDDGSLATAHRETLARLFPATRFISQAESSAKLDQFLPVSKFPALRERWLNYPNIRKLIDPHLGNIGWKLVLDSDLLFFRRPDFLIDWIDHPSRPLHAVDCETSYGYSSVIINELADTRVPERINVGLTGLKSESLDWEKLEYWCRTLIDKERTSYYLEQALVAILLADKNCAIAPASDYVTKPVPPEACACKAVMHHYVANSKRWYFQYNWRTASLIRR